MFGVEAVSDLAAVDLGRGRDRQGVGLRRGLGSSLEDQLDRRCSGSDFRRRAGHVFGQPGDGQLDRPLEAAGPSNPQRDRRIGSLRQIQFLKNFKSL